MNLPHKPHIMTLISATALGSVSMTLLLPSLPAMAAHFSTNSAVIQLLVQIYLATSSVVQLIVGPLSDRYGRRSVMLVAMVIFLVGTLLCLFAPNIEILILGRIVQSTAVTGMVVSRAIIRDLYEPNQAASQIGYLTMGMALGPMIAPTMGGFLDEHFGWQSNFIAMFALGSLITIAVFLTLKETNTQGYSSFREQIRHYPTLFRSRRFWGYSATAAFSVGTFYALLAGAPFVAYDVYHLTPTQFGLYFIIVTFGYILGNFTSGRFATKMGINTMALAGAVIATLGVLLAIILFELGFQHPLSIFGPMIFVGLGNGITLPSVVAGIVSVRPNLAGTASGLGGCVQMGGGALISAAAASMVAATGSSSTLLFMMFTVSAISILTALYVIYIGHTAADAEQL